MTNGYLTAMVIAGGMTGLGIFLLVVQLIPAPPALGPALRRLHPLTTPGNTPAGISWLRRRLAVPHADLRLLNRSTDQYFLTLGLSALFCLILPAVITIVVAVLRLPIPVFIPAGGTIAAALAGAALAHREVVSKAAVARAEFSRAMCTYLDLAAHQVLGGHGPVESLDRAASVCHGWVFVRIREALLSAQLQLRPPWDELKVLARDIEVIELGDLADIMRTAGSEGANVHQTLRARADSMRDRLRTEALAQAELRTNKLDIPAAALILVLLVLIGYPFMARLFIR
ncbi:type II secretion system F family protein [Micromonospora sp. C72]|uniref:type II secretion system F family protein n=1 Tax=Micromonospora sp. C72 TaxID=2824880 RepID=UPI001B365C22|nr:type II secretion system F family protein [Micromonospora sp. C72]MBQ1041471.1 type II secretion system F family protein [Micromonospora sp. C72]